MPTVSYRLCLVLVGMSVMLLAVGCGGSGPKRYQVSGKVTFKGQSVPAGDIHFEPDPVAGNSGPSGYAKIVDGTYNTASTGGKGVVGGPHIVRINGFSTKPIDPNSETPVPVLFRDYSTKADLKPTSNTVDFDVPEAAAIPKEAPKPAAGGRQV